MTLLWIILFLICFSAFLYGTFTGKTLFGVAGFIGAIIFIVCFFAVPVMGYMEVESTHWFWTVDIYEFKPCKHSSCTYHCDSELKAEELAENSIPEGAYDIKIEIISKKETSIESEWTDENDYKHELKRTEWYYYGEYSYTLNEWVYIGEVESIGNNKEPYEPERPYPTEAPNIIGERKCGIDHKEVYTVTGSVNGKMYTHIVSKSDWERINNNDEFEYKKFRFGEKIWSLQIAQ